MKKKKIIFFIILLSLFISNKVFAGVFPDNAITIPITVSGSATTTVVNTTTPKTILGVQMQQSNQASQTVVRCGTTGIVYNYATSTSQMLLSYLCNGTINILKTGNDDAHVVITYVNYDLAGGYAGSVIMNSNFTSGELMISTLLFLLLMLFLIYFLRSAINSVKIVRHYQGNNSPDGKEFYDV